MQITFKCQVCNGKFDIDASAADAQMNEHECPCCGRTRCPQCFIAADNGDRSCDCCMVEDDEDTQSFAVALEREADDKRWSRMED